MITGLSCLHEENRVCKNMQKYAKICKIMQNYAMSKLYIMKIKMT